MKKKQTDAAVTLYKKILSPRVVNKGPYPAVEGYFKDVSFDAAHSGSIIGSSGKTIKSITKDTGAKMDMAKKGHPAGCRVSGTEEQVAAAIERINKVIEENVERLAKQEAEEEKNREVADIDADISALAGQSWADAEENTVSGW